MVDITDDIKKQMLLQVENGKCFMSGESFSISQKAYFMTNENLSGYLKNFNFGYQNALTVTGSGDQIFSLLSQDILNIKTFDTNLFASYFALGLKKAMILKYNYKDYIKTLNTLSLSLDLNYQTQILLECLEYMDKEYRQFWEKIITYNYQIQKDNKTTLNFFHLLLMNIIDEQLFTKNNPYLIDEMTYEKMRLNLQKAKIDFTLVDARFLQENYQGQKFDIIILSNILDYFYRFLGNFWSKDKLKQYEQNLNMLLTEEGMLYLHYIFNYGCRNFKTHVIQNADILASDIEGTIIDFSNNKNKMRDGMILVKKKDI